MTGDLDSDPVARLKALALRQHGVASRAQVLEAGLSGHWVDLQLKKGWLESIHRGVYRVGPVVAPHQREMAALLACGVGAVLSHRSAAALWDILPHPGERVPVSVSTTRNLRGHSSRIRIYRFRSLGTDEVTSIGGLQLTTPARTLLDLAGTLPSRDLEQAVARADRRRLLHRSRLELLLARYPRRPGRSRIRTVLASMDGPILTRSEAEERFISLIRKVGLPLPQTNVLVNGFEVDALWQEKRLIAEIDGFAFHSTRTVFEKDRHRDGVLTAAGYRVLRITWRQLTQESDTLLVQLAQALAAGGAP